ncbi:MAG: MarR family transcriptional regulator [Ruminococcaceae bacterium]|nr:MarR family transcriptional regulator [Oscillospiraceae bacterium]
MSDMKNFETARVFLNFMVDYYALIRRHLVETNQFRIHSHGFSVLHALMNYRNRPITMTKFADEMGITKQQLTKLVNDLEEQNYVRRSHNKENRRQVYIEITDEGLVHIEQMIGEIIHEIVTTLACFSDDEKDEIIKAVAVLSEYFKIDAEICREKDGITLGK